MITQHACHTLRSLLKIKQIKYFATFVTEYLEECIGTQAQYIPVVAYSCDAHKDNDRNVIILISLFDMSLGVRHFECIKCEDILTNQEIPHINYQKYNRGIQQLNGKTLTNIRHSVSSTILSLWKQDAEMLAHLNNTKTIPRLDICIYKHKDRDIPSMFKFWTSSDTVDCWHLSDIRTYERLRGCLVDEREFSEEVQALITIYTL